MQVAMAGADYGYGSALQTSLVKRTLPKIHHSFFTKISTLAFSTVSKLQGQNQGKISKESRHADAQKLKHWILK